jgi:hypothetical protein
VTAARPARLSRAPRLPGRRCTRPAGRSAGAGRSPSPRGRRCSPSGRLTRARCTRSGGRAGRRRGRASCPAAGSGRSVAGPAPRRAAGPRSAARCRRRPGRLPVPAAGSWPGGSQKADRGRLARGFQAGDEVAEPLGAADPGRVHERHQPEQLAAVSQPGRPQPGGIQPRQPVPAVQGRDQRMGEVPPARIGAAADQPVPGELRRGQQRLSSASLPSCTFLRSRRRYFGPPLPAVLTPGVRSWWADPTRHGGSVSEEGRRLLARLSWQDAQDTWTA